MGLGKKLLIVLAIVLLIGAIAVGYLYSKFYAGKTPAVLRVEAGKVEVDKGNGWETAIDGMRLKQGWKLRTGQDGKASIFYFENSVMRVDAGSEIAIDELISRTDETTVTTSLNAGRVWNRVLRLSGIEKYSVKTPSAIATVRGTGFGMAWQAALLGALGTELYLTDGRVNMALVGQPGLDVTGPIAVSAASGQLNQFALPQDAWISSNIAQDKEWLRSQREHLKQKYSSLLNRIKEQEPELTDDVIDEHIDKFLLGEVTVQQALDKGIVPQPLIPLIPDELRGPRAE